MRASAAGQVGETAAAEGGAGAAAGSDAAGAGGGPTPARPAAGSGTRAQAGAAGSMNAGGRAGSAAAGPAQAGTGGSVGSEPSKPDESAELFDPTRVLRFDLELPAASIEALRAVRDAEDDKQDAWVHASFKYGDEQLKDVGVRLKGEGSFRGIDDKAAFKIKFDAFVQNQQFRALKRLTLNNMVDDPSFLAERLAYEVFRAAKLPAPRCNSALVYVNGKLYGLYAHVEAEDKPFIRRWFAQDSGNLYEEGQQDFLPGNENTFDLETNETANDRSDLRGLIAALNGASKTSLLADLGPHLDLPHFFRFTAAEAAVNQWDMYAYTVYFPNNFRLYADPSSHKLVFLPWGMDMSMKPFIDSGRKHIPIFGVAHNLDSPDREITAGLIFRKCLESAECKTRYASVVSEITNLYESLGLEATAARYYAQIRDYVRADPRKELSNDDFEEAYRKLISTIRERPVAIRADLAAR